MADSTISALPTGTPTGSDIIPFVQGGVNKKTTISALPSSAGDMVLASAQTVTGLKTFLDAIFGLRNVANTFTSFFTNTNTASRTYTLPDVSGTIVTGGGTASGTNTGDETIARINALYGTANAITVGSIELGNATDTTITRNGAGVMAVEGEVMNGYTTTATATSTTTLTIANNKTQYFTGTLAQIVKLPTTSVIVGQPYIIKNISTLSVTVQSSGANTIVILGAGMSATFIALVATPTTAANWDYTLVSGIDGVNSITATANAATINLAYTTNTVTNNSAALITITLPTNGAIDGEKRLVRVLDFSAVAQTLAWVNTENSLSTAPVLTNGSTTLPVTVGFQYNAATLKWRCIASS